MRLVGIKSHLREMILSTGLSALIYLINNSFYKVFTKNRWLKTDKIRF